jgi:catechol 2,3-dioxygenase-like lactoylglutathione lyase family enzyme
MDNSTNSSSDRQIKLVRIAHVYYTHKDIEKARRFLEDFGLQEVKRVGKSTYYRGTGLEPFVYCAREGDEDEFGGAAFVVESREDLEYAARTLPHATNIQELSDAPGGGSCVTFRDPIDGFPFHLVHGQTPSENVIAHSELKFNYVRVEILRIVPRSITNSINA